MEGTTSLPVLYFGWWYGYAYGRLFKYLRALYISDYDMFSVGICLKTLFSAWKRDFISYDGLTLQQRFYVLTLNLASRFTGFVIKTMTLLAFVVATIILTLIAVSLIIVWPLVPILAVLIIIAGFWTL